MGFFSSFSPSGSRIVVHLLSVDFSIRGQKSIHVSSHRKCSFLNRFIG